MKYGYKNIKLFIAFWLLTLGFTLSTGCGDEHSFVGPERGGYVSLQIDLNVPGLQPGGTKSMDIYKEAEINYATLQVLVFEETAAGDVFSYKATPEGNSFPFTVKVPVSRAGEKYRFVLLANTDPQTIGEGTGKEEALRRFLFRMAGKWNTSATSATPIPLWGESTAAFVLRDDRQLTILMHRALARVDVGNRFEFSDISGGEDVTKEKVLGLDNFKIKEIRLYRTRGEAYPASSADRMQGNEVTVPNIPASALFNSEEGTQYHTLEEADRFPLVYILPEASDRYIREIYIPESSLTDSFSNQDNVPCIVVGGYYGEENSSVITYYRVDFAHYANGVVDSYFPIVRNHRYVFDIRSVNAPGFATPGQALQSIVSDLELRVVNWNEITQNYYLQGDYHFLINEREVWMEALSQAGTAENNYIVPYQTDMELDGTAGKSFRYAWSSSGDRESPSFGLAIDYINKTLTFKAKKDNLRYGETLSETLCLGVENLQLNIMVHQKAVKLYKTKKILTIGANAIYKFGYMLEPGSASRAFMDAGVNFGLEANSTLHMEKNESGNAFDIEVMTAGKGMSGEQIIYEELVKKLNEFKPDIILTGQAINYFSSDGGTIDLLADFVERGGVFIMCNEYYPEAKSIEAMVQKIMGPEVEGNHQYITADHLLFQLNEYADDPIMNGPFGNMGGKQWGSDDFAMYAFGNLPSQDVIVYSTRLDGYANMFRHKSKPFFFVGDGGFISNMYTGNDYWYNYYCPFAIDANYRPIPRINYSPKKETVYNSQIFGNIIAWAVDYSENNRTE